MLVAVVMSATLVYKVLKLFRSDRPALADVDSRAADGANEFFLVTWNRRRWLGQGGIARSRFLFCFDSPFVDRIG